MKNNTLLSLACLMAALCFTTVAKASPPPDGTSPGVRMYDPETGGYITRSTTMKPIGASDQARVNSEMRLAGQPTVRSDSDAHASTAKKEVAK